MSDSSTNQTLRPNAAPWWGWILVLATAFYFIWFFSFDLPNSGTHTLHSGPKTDLAALNAGRITPEVHEFFTANGTSLAPGSRLVTIEPGRRWVLTEKVTRQPFDIVTIEDGFEIQLPRVPRSYLWSPFVGFTSYAPVWNNLLGVSSPDSSSAWTLPAIKPIVDLVRISDWNNRAYILSYASLILAGMLSVGGLVLRLIFKVVGPTQIELTYLERQSISFGLGLVSISVLTLANGLCGIMSQMFVVVSFTSAILLAMFLGMTSPWPRTGRIGFPGGWLSAVGIGVSAFFVLASVLGAMLPATDFDVREYHLQAPKEFFLAGEITFQSHNVYSSMPFGTQMISLCSMITTDDWWWGALVGQVVLASIGLVTALAVSALGGRLFGPGAGWLGGLLYLTTPWVYRISIIPYTESALCLCVALTTLCLVLVWGQTERRGQWTLWLLVGIMAGAGASCKYTAIISTIIPASSLCAWWIVKEKLNADTGDRRVVRSLASVVSCFLLGISLSFGPWLVKNTVQTGNPTYPLLYNVFGGANWSPEKNGKWEWGHRVPLLVKLGVTRDPQSRPVYDGDIQHGITPQLLRQNLTDVVARADWLSPLLFGSILLAFTRRDRKRAVVLFAGIVFLFVQWWLMTHRIDRFWVPMLPLVAAMAGAGLTWTDHRSWRMLAITMIGLSVFYNLSFCSTSLCGNNAYAAALNDSQRDPTDPVVNWLNQNAPPETTVLAVGGADLFHLARPVIYNTVFDDSIFERICEGRSAHEISNELVRLNVGIVYVNWLEIQRYRAPGSYGFTNYIQPSIFDKLVNNGVLLPIRLDEPSLEMNGSVVSPRQLYQVVSSKGVQ